MRLDIQVPGMSGNEKVNTSVQNDLQKSDQNFMSGAVPKARI